MIIGWTPGALEPSVGRAMVGEAIRLFCEVVVSAKWEDGGERGRTGTSPHLSSFTLESSGTLLAPLVTPGGEEGQHGVERATRVESGRTSLRVVESERGRAGAGTTKQWSARVSRSGIQAAGGEGELRLTVELMSEVVGGRERIARLPSPKCSVC